MANKLNILKWFNRKLSTTKQAAFVKPFQGIRISLEELIQLQHASRNMTLSSHKRVLTNNHGGRLSKIKGRGFEFEKVREYQPPDDISRINWRVTARTGKPHTKVFQEERERPVYIVVNQGQSMQFGTQVAFKSVIAAKAAALFAWSATHNHDRVGGFIYNDENCIELPARGRKLGVLPFLKALSESTHFSPGSKPSMQLGNALLKLRHVIRPGSAVIILSDFIDLNEHAEKQLGLLAKHCEIITGFIYDPLEKNPPPADYYRVSDGQNILTIDTQNPAFCTEYQRQFQVRLNRIKKITQSHQSVFLEMATTDDITQILKKGTVS